MKNIFRIQGMIFLVVTSFIFQSCKKSDLYYLKDVDGNGYTPVKIGTQIWMRENLKTTHDNDGTSITNVTDNTAWENLTSPAYCWYDNNATAYKATYGALYNWYAVNTGKLCPTGWHVPTDSEWYQLILFLDPGASLSSVESQTAGGSLKESGTDHWQSPNAGATDENFFTALPGGGRGSNGEFGFVGGSGNFWSSSENISGYAWYQGLAFDAGNIYRSVYSEWVGASVRCLKDN